MEYSNTLDIKRNINMPLTKKGMKLKGIFVKEYGRKKGINVFYAYEHKHAGLIRK
jgi:hypothetical protein